MTSAKTILVADDDASVRTVLSQALSRAGYSVEATDNGATLYQWVAEGRGDLVITDVMMPGENGIDLIPKIRRRAPSMKVIVISAQNPLTTAVAAAEKGALDYLPKPFDIEALLDVVGRALQKTGVPNDNRIETAEALGRSFVTGQSRAMQEIYRTVARLQSSDLTVLLTGESGTGKEVIARALHGYSHRKGGPFVAVNVAAMPKDLIESELFGHERGAFTGAVQKAQGRFEQAAGGTLFLDEIGDMPYEAQTRLLRVLQEGEFTTVGGRRAVKADVRVIAATHQDIRALVRQGKFREDLFYRLNVIALHIPPLRERREDIPSLVQHFIAGRGKVVSPDAMNYLQQRLWRGNIRELENTMRRIVALTRGDVIDLAAVGAEPPEAIAGGDVAALIDGWLASCSGSGVYDYVLQQVEKPLIEKVLRQTGGNQIRTAEILGMNRNTLRKKIRELSIDVRRSS